MKSSRYDLNILGYTCATIVKTNRNYFVKKNYSVKITIYFGLVFET